MGLAFDTIAGAIAGAYEMSDLESAIKDLEEIHVCVPSCFSGLHRYCV